MHAFWYHSPVRFYRTPEELEDMTNPQNTQYFGHKNPYPLEYNSYHRFLIPNYENEIESEDLELWLVGREEIRIACEFGINDGKLFRVSFICDQLIAGNFEIRYSSGETLFYSNCVQFVNSEDGEGRKFIRIATKHTYNRNLFAFDNSNYDWMVTNLPARCLGIFDIDEDVKAERKGNQVSTSILDAWTEENVEYTFEIAGDCNILSFIAIHSTNNEFYIDGTKRVRKEKPEKGDFSSTLRMKFSNVKDENGLNVLLNEKDIFSDAFKKILSNRDKTLIYTYHNNNVIPLT